MNLVAVTHPLIQQGATLGYNPVVDRGIRLHLWISIVDQAKSAAA